MSEWMLCPAAHEEARRTGLVYCCEGRRNHVCNGPRTPHHWQATAEVDGVAVHFESEQPCCGSCVADEEFGYRDIGYDCCCVHGAEYRLRPTSGSEPASQSRGRART